MPRPNQDAEPDDDDLTQDVPLEAFSAIHQLKLQKRDRERLYNLDKKPRVIENRMAVVLIVIGELLLLALCSIWFVWIDKVLIGNGSSILRQSALHSSCFIVAITFLLPQLRLVRIIQDDFEMARETIFTLVIEVPALIIFCTGTASCFYFTSEETGMARSHADVGYMTIFFCIVYFLSSIIAYIGWICKVTPKLYPVYNALRTIFNWFLFSAVISRLKNWAYLIAFFAQLSGFYQYFYYRLKENSESAPEDNGLILAMLCIHVCLICVLSKLEYQVHFILNHQNSIDIQTFRRVFLKYKILYEPGLTEEKAAEALLDREYQHRD